ncbi:hypothetical protein C5Y93_23470 [Blastopirellula marina]|uniref:Uncharacterized protein n=1 Tax=Blastopirellula marina TaxID=124 RepID=A0A2S8GH54_9BACT|nr:hypothetical protein C5Y93_23470 [Blastopirellula marina]
MSVPRNYAIRFRPSGGDAENDTRFVGGAIGLRLCGTTGTHRRYVRRYARGKRFSNEKRRKRRVAVRTRCAPTIPRGKRWDR